MDHKAHSLHERITLGLLLGLITLAIYLPGIFSGFVNYDDGDYVTQNPQILQGITLPNIGWAFSHFCSANWHPLTWLSHMLDCQLYHLTAGGHHFTSLAFHTFNTVLLFVLLQQLTGSFWRSALVAALFSLHPMHVESVVWISERKDVLSAFFFLITLLCYTRFAQLSKNAPTNRPRAAAAIPRSSFSAKDRSQGFYYLLALVAFVLGLMSKPMVVTLPFVLILLDLWPLGRLPLLSLRSSSPGKGLFFSSSAWHSFVRTLVLEKLPFFLLSIGSCALTLLAQRSAGAIANLEQVPFDFRLSNAVFAVFRYLGKLLWPTDLAVAYPLTASLAHGWGLALLGLLSVTLLGLWLYNSRPYLMVGWLWFVGMLIPVIGLVQVGQQAIADRYSYLPSVGLFLALVWGIEALFHSFSLPRWIPGLLSGCALTVYGIQTETQITYWDNSETLFCHSLKAAGLSFPACVNLGCYYGELNELRQSESCYRAAVELDPDSAYAWAGLGGILAKQRRYDESLPCYTKALGLSPSLANAHCDLGFVYSQQGNPEAAKAQFQEALGLDCTSLSARLKLSNLLLSQGASEQAVETLQAGLRCTPSEPVLHLSLAEVLARQNKLPDSIEELRKAIALAPNSAEAHTQLAQTLFQTGSLDAAKDQYALALNLAPQNADVQFGLAQVLFQQGQCQAAVQYYQQGLRSAPAAIEPLNNLAWIRAANSSAALRNGKEAVALAEKACQLTNNKQPLLLGTLAAAYAEAGRFPEAIQTAERARALALDAGLKEVADKNSQLLDLYRRGKPYHEPGTDSSK